MAGDEVLDEGFLKLLAVRRHGVLTTIKRDGRPQLSIVSYAYDAAARVIRMSVTFDRAKTRNLQRDPRASFFVATPDSSSYAVAEGEVELSPVAKDAHDATIQELIDIHRLIAGEHPDWDEYRAAMVGQGRLVVRLPIARLYGRPA